jgi:hypothetical protein
LNEQIIIDTFTSVTSAFIHRRMDRILSAEPRSQGLDRRRAAAGAPAFSLEVQRDTGTLASRLQVDAVAGALPRGAVDVTASDGRPSTSLTFSGRALSADHRWYAWTEGQYSVYRDETGTLARRDGRFGMASVGADYLVNERLSVGVMLQADRAAEDIDGFSGVSGRGWMIGPYLSAELTSELFFTGRLAWGASSNSSEIDIEGQTWNGDFSTRRMLARAAVYGRYAVGGMTIQPQIDLAYMRERQAAYTVTNGVSVVEVPGITAEIGRLSLSAEMEWALGSAYPGILAFVTPKLDGDFLNTGAATREERLRGSLEIGLRTAPIVPWRGEIALRSDGIGQRGFSALTLRIGASIDF